MTSILSPPRAAEAVTQLQQQVILMWKWKNDPRPLTAEAHPVLGLEAATGVEVRWAAVTGTRYWEP